MLTTTIGAYPKPNYVPTPDWFSEGDAGLSSPIEAYQKYLAEKFETLFEIPVDFGECFMYPDPNCNNFI